MNFPKIIIFPLTPPASPINCDVVISDKGLGHPHSFLAFPPIKAVHESLRSDTQRDVYGCFHGKKPYRSTKCLLLQEQESANTPQSDHLESRT